ncbi:cotranscriptional regulator FAM172A homolog [Amphibalanus amphitrite]|uniref:cotranscriptional regulator FAM172A homolog n=1 Tax=Amphibalanus amphitrite TaxID=1232801 RepID=UPI001C91E79D|nr:cotranscriptional regulator FAM172A homolog [Amphibalanus amphitrite]
MGNSPFPTKLKDFGYEFKDGSLKDIKTGGGFEFNVSKDAEYNQARYEALGEVITEEVYALLESEAGLQRLPVPANAADGEPTTFVFASANYRTADKLLLLVHGSGVVRAGQWARRLIINNGVKEGTQLPYIERALSAGYGVLVLNTNDNRRVTGERKQFIRDSGTPEQHALTVWDTYVRGAAATDVAIVAHSYGGVVTLNLAVRRWEEVQKRVSAVALTDSVHSMGGARCGPEVQKWLAECAVNWVTSSSPLDTELARPTGDACRRSAGHKQHEWTSWSCIDAVFPFLEQRLEQRRKAAAPATPTEKQDDGDEKK